MRIHVTEIHFRRNRSKLVFRIQHNPSDSNSITLFCKQFSCTRGLPVPSIPRVGAMRLLVRQRSHRIWLLSGLLFPNPPNSQPIRVRVYLSCRPSESYPPNRPFRGISAYMDCINAQLQARVTGTLSHVAWHPLASSFRYRRVVSENRFRLHYSICTLRILLREDTLSDGNESFYKQPFSGLYPSRWFYTHRNTSATYTVHIRSVSLPALFGILGFGVVSPVPSPMWTHTVPGLSQVLSGVKVHPTRPLESNEGVVYTPSAFCLPTGCLLYRNPPLLFLIVIIVTVRKGDMVFPKPISENRFLTRKSLCMMV